eukprot:CAMPEP_0184645028 /NCGR_PEP_ID=MMETSP0308-20130426/1595_1 /TAXON_ID=38269 /ORGANISM="Gloeochaete witrockiana, Strain SAG 46.84" /LENGTH=373 /DNA_ID=CAMNT_0027073813 /DNA_START=158 /DNA_END=1276 /DNA_ORIENTATION=+
MGWAQNDVVSHIAKAPQASRGFTSTKVFIDELSGEDSVDSGDGLDSSNSRDSPPPLSSSPELSDLSHSIINVDVYNYCVDQRKPEEGALAVCSHFVPAWANATLDQVRAEMVSGGITNKLFKCTLRGVDAPPVLIRVYGDNTELLIDRTCEQAILATLSSRNVKPTLYGVFTNGQLQEYLPARPLRPEEMGHKHFVPLIARKVAELHRLDAPLHKEPALWSTIEKWMQVASSCKFTDPVKIQKHKLLNLTSIAKEIEELKEILAKIPSPTVLAHDDLLSGNILYDDDSGEMYLIDYEYGMYSYRGFDLGNHFQEYAGFDCDYSRYPTREQQYLFFRAYLEEFNGFPPSEDELDALYNEVTKYGLVAHIFWGVW